MNDSEIQEKLEEGYLQVRMIVEIAGTPAEHVAKTLDLVNESLSKIKDVKIIQSEKEEPKKVEENDKLFSAFIEIEMLIKNTPTLVSICFEFMPSSVEILEPANLKLNTNDASNLFNDVLGRIHNMDMVLKNKSAENQILKKNASTLLRNIFKLSLKQSSKTKEELSKDIGVPADQLTPFLEVMEKQKEIKKEGDKFSLP